MRRPFSTLCEGVQVHGGDRLRRGRRSVERAVSVQHRYPDWAVACGPVRSPLSLKVLRTSVR